MNSADGDVAVSYTWDSLNRLSTVADSRLGTTTYSYDGANNLATATYPNHLQSSYSYDPENRLTYLVTPPAAGYSYQLGPTGNRTSAAETNGRVELRRHLPADQRNHYLRSQPQ